MVKKINLKIKNRDRKKEHIQENRAQNRDSK